MKITYEFADGTRSEVEVDEELGSLIIDSHRKEENGAHTIRRHCISLEYYQENVTEIASDENIEADFVMKMETERLRKAISELQPQQQILIERIYYKNEKPTDIAHEEGVTPMAINNRLNKIFAILRKKL